jgi:predicted nucleic acid-binding protein
VSTDVTDFLDASVLLRYLVEDTPAHTERARRLIDDKNPRVVTETALLETAYTLTKQYHIPREKAVDTLIDLVQKSNIVIHHFNKPTVIAALLLCRPSGRVSFGDALIWAAAREAGPSVIHSFDRRFPSEGIDLREPK